MIDLVKEKYLLNNKIGKTKIIEKIEELQKKLFIYTSDYNEIFDIKNYVINDENINKLNDISNTTFGIINEKFLQYFSNKNSIGNINKSITFYLSFQTIKIKSKNSKLNLSFEAKNNIITINKGKEYIDEKQISNGKNTEVFKFEVTNNLENIKNLIKIIYFKKEYISVKSIFKKSLTKAYIINIENFMKKSIKFNFNNINKIIKIIKNSKI